MGRGLAEGLGPYQHPVDAGADGQALVHLPPHFVQEPVQIFLPFGAVIAPGSAVQPVGIGIDQRLQNTHVFPHQGFLHKGHGVEFVLDGLGIDVFAAGKDDHRVQAAADKQIAYLVQAAQIAGTSLDRKSVV